MNTMGHILEYVFKPIVMELHRNLQLLNVKHEGTIPRIAVLLRLCDISHKYISYTDIIGMTDTMMTIAYIRDKVDSVKARLQ